MMLDLIWDRLNMYFYLSPNYSLLKCLNSGILTFLLYAVSIKLIYN